MLKYLIGVAIFIFLSLGNLFASELDGIIQSFEDRSGYLQPIASLLGEAMNSGWYQSAHVGKNFGFYIGLPMNSAFVGTKDQSYTATLTDPSGAVPPQSFQAPTILGGKAPTVYQYILGLNHQKIDSVAVPYSDGLINLPALPFAALQLGFSAYNTELNLRYTGVPGGVKGATISMPGFGIQHDLSWLLPTEPLSLSVAANFTFLDVATKSSTFPASNSVSGSLNLSGVTSFAGVLAGYKWKSIEVFLDGGWEHSNISTSGTLNLEQLNQSVSPGVHLVGRDNIQIGLNLAFDLGWTPVLGASLGNVNAVSANIFSYKYSSD